MDANDKNFLMNYGEFLTSKPNIYSLSVEELLRAKELINLLKNGKSIILTSDIKDQEYRSIDILVKFIDNTECNYQMIYKINIVTLTNYYTIPGMLEYYMCQITDILKNNPNILIYIENINQLLERNKNDIYTAVYNALKPLIENSSIKVIGTTTNNGYGRILDNDMFFEKKYNVYKMSDINKEEFKRIIKDFFLNSAQKNAFTIELTGEQLNKIIDVICDISISNNGNSINNDNIVLAKRIISDIFSFAEFNKDKEINVRIIADVIKYKNYINEDISKCYANEILNSGSTCEIIQFPKLPKE